MSVVAADARAKAVKFPKRKAMRDGITRVFPGELEMLTRLRRVPA